MGFFQQWSKQSDHDIRGYRTKLCHDNSSIKASNFPMTKLVYAKPIECSICSQRECRLTGARAQGFASLALICLLTSNLIRLVVNYTAIEKNVWPGSKKYWLLERWWKPKSVDKNITSSYDIPRFCTRLRLYVRSEKDLGYRHSTMATVPQAEGDNRRSIDKHHFYHVLW